MDAIDGTEHRAEAAQGPPPSLLVIILDLNLYAWKTLSPILPLPSALANLLVFINAHLAFSHENHVAVLASNSKYNGWLYAPSLSLSHPSLQGAGNKYGPFAEVESSILSGLHSIFGEAQMHRGATHIAGALSTALDYINEQTIFAWPTRSDPQDPTAPPPPLNSRILVVSTSSDLTSQYIPLMNATFAAQHDQIPIDVLKLAGDAVLLQQVSFTTGGIFIQPQELKSQSSSQPISLLPYLMQGLLPDAAARTLLYPPSDPHVDFGASCFCHQDVVDVGYVCSICLSIFCSADLEDGRCLTCSTKLALSEDGDAPVKKDKKKKRAKDGAASGVGTPAGQF